MPNTVIVNLKHVERKTLVGQELGEELRKLYKLDELDLLKGATVEILFNDILFATSQSFLRAFLKESILKHKTEDDFFDMYKFPTLTTEQEVVKNSIEFIVEMTIIDRVFNAELKKNPINSWDNQVTVLKKMNDYYKILKM